MLSDAIKDQIKSAHDAFARGGYEVALAEALAILERQPKEPNATRLVGLCMGELGEPTQGATLLAQAAATSLAVCATELDPERQRFGLEWAASCLIEAAEAFQALNDHVTANELLLKSLKVGRPPLTRYLKVSEGLCEVERYHEALEVLQRAERSFPRALELLRALGAVHAALGDKMRAIQAYSAVCALKPSDQDALSRVDRLLSAKVPTWHFPMMNDLPRNEAFRAAIEARMSATTKVLDIGCGSGLLSLIAARAGAEAVYACESEPQVSRVATQVISLNELEDVIRVIPKRSTQMQLGVDLPERLDMLVCEIFDVSLLGEDALNTIEDAKRRLLKEGAKIIPCGARVWCQLVESDELRARYHVDSAEGFDLSPFNQLRDPRVLQLDLRRFDYTPLTAPCLAASFDFEGEFSQLGEAVLSTTVERAGRADGFIFWYDLILAPDEEHVMSTSPHVDGTHWMQGFAPCYDGQRQLEAGELTHFMCAYRRFLLSFKHL